VQFINGDIFNIKVIGKNKTITVDEKIWEIKVKKLYILSPKSLKEIIKGNKEFISMLD
jgi:hypothetical protein